MRHLLAILTVILLASCHRNIAPQASTESTTTDSFLVEYFYHDTVITALPVVTAIHDTIPCPGLDYERLAKTNGQTVSIKAHGGILDVTCKSDSLNQIIKVLSKKISEKERSRTDSTIIVQVPVPVTKYPKILWWSLGLNLLAIVALYFTLKGSVVSSVGSIISLITKIKL